jgi:GxxExxY protein
LCYELEQGAIPYSRQVALPLVYKQTRLDGEYRLDLVVGGTVVIEVKAMEQLRSVHDAQLLTYLRLSGLRLVLILNFGSALLKDGIRRLVL